MVKERGRKEMRRVGRKAERRGRRQITGKKGKRRLSREAANKRVREGAE